MQSSADLVAEQLSGLASEYAEKVSVLAGTDPNLRNGVMKPAVRETLWAITEQFKDQQLELVEMLEVMTEAIRDHETESDSDQLR